MTTCSAPWSVITSAPRSVPLMLKLATLPRSRRERDWWRATPGRSGKGAALPLPAESPAERTGVCVTRRVPNSAILERRVPNSASLERRSHIGIRHARRPERARATTQAARAGRPKPVEHDGTRRRCGAQRATSEDTAGGSRRCLDSPNGRRRDPVRPPASRSGCRGTCGSAGRVHAGGALRAAAAPSLAQRERAAPLRSSCVTGSGRLA